MSTSPREGSANAGSSNGLDEKPRLSEHEKKANHIASGELPSASLTPIFFDSASADFFNVEQKRRQAIREGFDRLTELVPGLEGQGRSESVVLKKTVDYMRAQLEERRRLVGRLDELGGQVEDGMRR
jgi:heteromeric Ino2p/Ino4p transcription factor